MRRVHDADGIGVADQLQLLQGHHAVIDHRPHFLVGRACGRQASDPDGRGADCKRNQASQKPSLDGQAHWASPRVGDDRASDGRVRRGRNPNAMKFPLNLRIRDGLPPPGAALGWNGTRNPPPHYRRTIGAAARGSTEKSAERKHEHLGMVDSRSDRRLAWQHGGQPERRGPDRGHRPGGCRRLRRRIPVPPVRALRRDRP